jgi:hypothetical protein
VKYWESSAEDRQEDICVPKTLHKVDSDTTDNMQGATSEGGANNVTPAQLV